MDVDLATFLTTVYYVVDEVYQTAFAPLKPKRRGAKPELSDSEVITLAVVAQWQSGWGERTFLAYAKGHWRSYFPRLLSQGAFNRRVRDLAGVIARIGPLVAADVDAHLVAGDAEVLDGVPVPLMRRCRGLRHRLFADEAGIGVGGSDREWYYGVKLVAATDPSGIITGFVIAPASTEERWDVEALLRWRNDPEAPAPTADELAFELGPSHRKAGARQGPTGPIRGRSSAGAVRRACYLADEGERGDAWQDHWKEAYDASILTASALAPTLPEDARAAAVHRLHSRRQVIETVNRSLVQVFGLKFPRARTPWGLFARLAAKVAAHDLSVCLNHLFQRPAFATFHPLTL